MFSGKAAAVDLVREFDGYYVPYYRYEFPLIRVQDGIMDLEKALVDDWSPIRSDVAIKRFRSLVTKMANSATRLSIREEDLVAWGYDSQFGGKFLEYSIEYLESLIDVKMRAPWPYYELAQPANELLSRRMALFLRGRFGRLLQYGLAAWARLPQWLSPASVRAFNELLRGIMYPMIMSARQTRGVPPAAYGWPDVELFVAGGKDFYAKTQQYLERVLSIPVTDADAHTIVFLNCFEPYNPWRPIRYFRDAKCIVVDRDPRDMYVTSLTYSEGFNDHPEVYSRIAGATNVDFFIRRYAIHREKTNRNLDPEGRVLRLRFEELVKDYDQVLSRVYDFLGESSRTHTRKRKYFDPAVSVGNVGMWKQYPRQDEIAAIRSALTQYCYED